jgi:hypothetical protein
MKSRMWKDSQTIVARDLVWIDDTGLSFANGMEVH